MSRPAECTPFAIDADVRRVRDIIRRVAEFRWDAVPPIGDSGAGIDLPFLREVCDHWVSDYSWKRAQSHLNELPQFIAMVQGAPMHFIHRGSGNRGTPLLLLHGWPGTCFEFEKVVELLCAAGHEVVVPSLPGFLYSGLPGGPVGPRAAAAMLNELMTSVLRHDRYLVHGTDWGSSIGSWMAVNFPQHVEALHLGMVFLQARDARPSSPVEEEWATRRRTLWRRESGYFALQSTRPQTLSIALSDSPVGLAGWILEKYSAWSDLPRLPDGRPDVWSIYDRDQLVTIVMLYLLSGSSATSLWMYLGSVSEETRLPERPAPPVGIAACNDPVFPVPPRSFVEQSYRVRRWTEMPRGGHFPGLECPAELAADIHAFSKE